jgi:hypothetical protein
MVCGDLDENDWYPVGILEPHLDQSPGLDLWFPQHLDSSCRLPFILSADVADLEPEHQRVAGGWGTVAGYLQKARAEKEHHSRIVRRAELPVDRQAQHVTVKRRL